MEISLFTHHFLEPTHHAIAQILTSMSHHKFHVFAKRFADQRYFAIPNVLSRSYYTRGPIDSLKLEASDLVQAIYDGKTAFRAGVQARHSGRPFLLSYHGGFDTNAKIFDKRYMDAARELTESATAVTVPCRRDVDRLKQIGVKRDVHVVPVPIDLTLLPIRTNPQPCRLTMAARFVEKKGFDVSLRALAILPPEARLHLAGEGPLHSPLRALAHSLSLDTRITWHGLLPLRETLELLASSVALLHPSRIASDGNADGVPQVILWAMAIGVPVIATATGSIDELVEHEKTGLIVPPEDSKALANAVSRLLGDPALTTRIRAEAMERVVNRHSLPKVVEQLDAIYRGCVHG